MVTTCKQRNWRTNLPVLEFTFIKLALTRRAYLVPPASQPCIHSHKPASTSAHCTIQATLNCELAELAQQTRISITHVRCFISSTHETLRWFLLNFEGTIKEYVLLYSPSARNNRLYEYMNKCFVALHDKGSLGKGEFHNTKFLYVTVYQRLTLPSSRPRGLTEGKTLTFTRSSVCCRKAG